MTLLIDDRLDDGTNGATFIARGALGIPGGITAPNYIQPGYLGGLGVVFNTGTSPVVQLIEATSTSSTTKYLDVLCYLSAAVNATGNIMTLRGTADVARLGITSTNTLRLFNGTGTSLGTSTATMPTGTWFRLALSVVGNTATVNYYADATSATITETLTGTVTGAAMTLCRFGNVNGVNLNGGTMRLDWPQVSNDAAPGLRSTTLTATATVSPTSLTKPDTLNLNIIAAGGSGTYSYQVLDWGDGSTSGSQGTGAFTKSILSGATTGSKTVSWRVTG